MSDKAVRQKIARLRAGKRLRVLDLFSGCGGLSLGFQAAGAEISAAIESDPDAARSHGMNFHAGAEPHTRPRDITTTKPAQLTEELSLGHPALAFDIIVGGPPCQAFARVATSQYEAHHRFHLSSNGSRIMGAIIVSPLAFRLRRSSRCMPNDK